MSQEFLLYDHPAQMEPLLPGEHKLGPLLELSHDLIRLGERLAGRYRPDTLPGLRRLLRAMNSYYSNRIEGQHTFPLDIERALHNDYAQDEDQARRQRLALAHMATEEQLEYRSTQWTNAQVWTPQMLADIHQDLFARLPQADLEAGALGDDAIEPGRWRTREVSVGRHAAPAAGQLPFFLDRWSSFYSGVRRGELQLVAMAAAHQRLAWIHPFRDGNGRVARLHSHLVLTHMGLSNGLWSPLRGFARSQERYYALLAAADEPRRGDLDGRGNLTELGLIDWIAYVLELCMDQVSFMEGLLSLDGMKERMAACLAYEERVVRQGVRSEALRALHYLFAAQAEMDRADFKAMLGLGDRLATAQVSALLKRGLLETDSPYGRVRLGVPLHALRFYFPRLWPEAEADSL
ncbi:Fic family protein [Delftia acidovorans]|jgi:Fic family protein|uniref:Fic family protein n=1 Tax=Delftia acidovorans TaxID=80866 RepID=A0A7T2S6N5_DELAC|nr:MULTISPECIES: Fic family protein [Delftia]AEF90661.1 filamentation induced by cAMP protein Fic [Delftia sp. Cs1-4]KZK28143.1 cell filamentation protein Fic [Delftia sp. GW456-R20]MBB1650077.1 cell filamentation protein Fic [Delftia sp. UME58]MBK0116047.1 Fic family protein [Delftia sp. S65]MBK0119076.1 Fic family protein [Delftia sp. S67]